MDLWYRQKTDSQPLTCFMVEAIDSITHTSIGFGLFSAQPSDGIYTFTVPLEKAHFLSKSRLERVAGFIDPRNYLLFSIDQKGFESFTVRDGRRESHGA
jgi:hypothetical protein